MTYYSDYCDLPSCIYRLFDSSGTLLYVGMTRNPTDRIAAHRRRKPWGQQVTREEVTWCESREAAKEAERIAIHMEHPMHNIIRCAPGTV